MIEISIGLGIVLSLVLSESLGVTAGGIIVPGYISLYLHQPIQVIITLLVAIIVWGIIQGLGKIIFLYGKRRIVLALILGNPSNSQLLLDDNQSLIISVTI